MGGHIMQRFRLVIWAIRGGPLSHSVRYTGIRPSDANLGFGDEQPMGHCHAEAGYRSESAQFLLRQVHYEFQISFHQK